MHLLPALKSPIKSSIAASVVHLLLLTSLRHKRPPRPDCPAMRSSLNNCGITTWWSPNRGKGTIFSSLRNDFLLPWGGGRGTGLRNHRCHPKLSNDGGGGREGLHGMRSEGWGLFPLPDSMPCQEQLVPCLRTSLSEQVLTPSPQLCRGPDMHPQLVQNWMCQARKCPKCLATHSPLYLPHLSAVGSLSFGRKLCWGAGSPSPATGTGDTSLLWPLEGQKSNKVKGWRCKIHTQSSPCPNKNWRQISPTAKQGNLSCTDSLRARVIKQN